MSSLSFLFTLKGYFCRYTYYSPIRIVLYQMQYKDKHRYTKIVSQWTFLSLSMVHYHKIVVYLESDLVTYFIIIFLREMEFINNHWGLTKWVMEKNSLELQVSDERWNSSFTCSLSRTRVMSSPRNDNSFVTSWRSSTMI